MPESYLIVKVTFKDVKINKDLSTSMMGQQVDKARIRDLIDWILEENLIDWMLEESEAVSEAP